MGKVIFAVVWLLIEGMGVPLLSEFAFGPLGYAVATHHISMPTAFLAAWIATSTGNAIGFFVFYRYGQGLLDWLGKRWSALERQRAELEPKVRLQLFLAVTVSRFVGLGTFQLVLWFAGVFRTNWKRFLPYLFALNFVWTAVWLFGSKWLIRKLLPFLEGKSWVQITAMIVTVVFLMWVAHQVVTWGQKRYKERKRSN